MFKHIDDRLAFEFVHWVTLPLFWFVCYTYATSLHVMSCSVLLCLLCFVVFVLLCCVVLVSLFGRLVRLSLSCCLFAFVIFISPLIYVFLFWAPFFFGTPATVLNVTTNSQGVRDSQDRTSSRDSSENCPGDLEIEG